MNNTGETEPLGFATRFGIGGIRSKPGTMILAIEVEDADKKREKQSFKCLLTPEQAITLGAQLADAGEKERTQKHFDG